MEICQGRKKHIPVLMLLLSVLPHKRQLLHMYLLPHKPHTGPLNRARLQEAHTYQNVAAKSRWQENEQKGHKSICVHAWTAVCFITFLYTTYSSNVLIFFAAKCIFWSRPSKSFYSHFCAHPVHLLNRDKDIFIFFYCTLPWLNISGSIRSSLLTQFWGKWFNRLLMQSKARPLSSCHRLSSRQWYSHCTAEDVILFSFSVAFWQWWVISYAMPEWECIILSKFNGKDLQGQAVLLLYHQREIEHTLGIHNWNLDGITAYLHWAGHDI